MSKKPDLSPLLGMTMNYWDPTFGMRWNQNSLPAACLLRIKRDIMTIQKEPLPGIHVLPDENDFTLIHAIVIGPADTPYQGGNFYFVLRFPPDYPISAPRVKLMTTGENKVRFNPNLYNCGKVCLSILGTWPGPSWSPVQTISTVLLSIQSLMSEKPYFNEPGYDKEREPGDSNRYNQIIKHETLRVAVCDMVEGRSSDVANCPLSLRTIMEKSFLKFHEYYETQANANMHLDKQYMTDPFCKVKVRHFNYADILKRLQAIKVILDGKPELLLTEDDASSGKADLSSEGAGDNLLEPEEFIMDDDSSDDDSSDDDSYDAMSEDDESEEEDNPLSEDVGEDAMSESS